LVFYYWMPSWPSHMAYRLSTCCLAELGHRP
jgi:hypothetical protein